MSAWKAPGCRRSLEVKGFFHRYGQPEQRAAAARCPLPVRGEGRPPRAVEVSDHNRVDGLIQFLDTCDGGLDQIERRDLVLLQRPKLFAWLIRMASKRLPYNCQCRDAGTRLA